VKVRQSHFSLAHLWRNQFCAINALRLKENLWRKGARQRGFSFGACVTATSQLWRYGAGFLVYID
jgi:hypothetical protein